MATVAEKIIEVKTKVEGENSVKSLKEQIAELTHLMDNLDTESFEYHQTVDMLVDAQEELNTVMKAGKSQLSAQEGSYNALVNRMTALKKTHKAVTDEATRNRLSDEIGKINDQLKEMDAKNGVYVRNVGNYENAIKAALKTPQQELKALRQQLAQLTEGTAEYNAVFSRMAQLTHDVTEQQEMLKWSSADLGDILGNISGVATSIAGGFSAFNALSGLIGGESKEMEQAMLQAQRFIQLIQGLEQLEQLADKIKGLWSGIKNFVNTTTVGTAALADFQQETEKVEAASTGAASAINTNAAATNTGAEAAEKNADAVNKEADAYERLTDAMVEALVGNAEYVETLEAKLETLTEEYNSINELLNSREDLIDVDEDELKIIKQVNRGLQERSDDLYNEIGALKKKIETVKEHGKTIRANADEELDALDEITKKTKENIDANELKHKGLKGLLATMILNSKQNKATVAEINAMTAAQLRSAAATVAWSTALSVFKTALISTGIGAIIVALGYLLSLLGKGLGALWDWVSGTNKAKERTAELQESFEALNSSLDKQEKSWRRTEMLMKAQGKSAEELYEAEKKVIQAKLAETSALLASQEAIAKEIGQRKLQKEKYDEFRETLEELRKKEQELKDELSDFNWEHYCDKIEKARNAEEKRAEEAKKAAEQAAENAKRQKEEAENLYKSLVEYYKSEQQKLKEKYDKEKAMLEKYGKDTSLLTKKYEEDKTKIVLKEEEARRKAREEYNKLFDSTIRPNTLEYFENELDKATDKLTDFQDVNALITRDENGMHTLSGYSKAIKELNEDYDLSIDNLSEFDLAFKKATNDYDDAVKALEDYKKQLREIETEKKVQAIEEQIDAIQKLMEWETQQSKNKYDLLVSEQNFYWDFTNNYITQMYERWSVEDAIHNQRVERINEEIALYKKLAEDTTITEEARLDALKKVADLEKELTQETTDYTITANTRKVEVTENYVTAVQDSLNGIGDILSNVASAWETSIQAQIDAGEISEEEGEKQMENMRGIQSAIAMINALSSAVGAYNSMASIPFVGPALGAAAAAAALASGIAQVVAINKVKKGDKGGEDNSRYAEAIPTMPDYNPQAVTNVTGEQETQNLANAMSAAPIKAYVVESEITSTQQKVANRNKEATF